MAGKNALLLIAEETNIRDLVEALDRLGIKSTCLLPRDTPPAIPGETFFDYVFFDEDLRWTTELLIYANRVRQSNSACSITILNNDGQPDKAIPDSDAYVGFPVQERVLQAVLKKCEVDKGNSRTLPGAVNDQISAEGSNKEEQPANPQSDTALQLSEQKYRVLFNAMREGLVLHEIIYDERDFPVDFRYLDVNPVFERMTGLQRDDVVGKLMSETPHWYDSDWPGDYLKVAISGKPYRVEIFIPDLDRHFDIVAFRPQSGQCAAIISDITVRKIHEKEIEGVAKYSSALRSVETPAEITHATLQQINDLIKANRSLLALTHSKTNEVLVRGATGPWTELIGTRIDPDDSISQIILASGDILYRDDLSEETGSLLARLTPKGLAFLGVPLIVESSPFGFLALCQEAPFTTAEIYSITAIAENTASAIRRSILLEQTKIYADQMKTVSEIGRSLVEIFDLPTLYSRLCTAVNDLLEAPDFVVLWLFNHQNELIVEFAVEKDQPVLLQETSITRFSTPSQELMKWINDNHIPYINNPASPDTIEKAELLVPIFSKGKNLGMLSIHRGHSEMFDETDAKLLSLVAHMGAIAIENARLLDATQLSLKRLTALHSIDTAVASSLDLQLTLNVILDQILALLGVDAADILLFDPITQDLEYAHGRGFLNHTPISTLQRFEETFTPQILTSIHTFNLSHSETNFLASSFKRALIAEGMLTYSLIPLLAKGQMKGILEIYQRKSIVIDTEWQDFLETLAGQAAIAIDNATLFNDLQRSNFELTMAYDTTLEGWSYALDLRDKETEGHTKRVTRLSQELAREMGINEQELVHIRRGALLHDIGKMGIPDHILLKAGPLTTEEREIMCKHPTYAYDMLSRIDFLGPAVEIPYYHHEKWDGTGYPNGLKGDQIPLSARIFAVIDVWDSLISNRPYRAAWPKDKVISYIQEMSGTHFDPAVVDIFLTKRIWIEDSNETN